MGAPTPTRVLIVDDEDNHRRTLAIGLRLEAFRGGKRRPDGESAIALFETGADFDVAIVDLMMPGINGLDLAVASARTDPTCGSC
ncbi:MAG: response regulator [Polyangiales bacterium]